MKFPVADVGPHAAREAGQPSRDPAFRARAALVVLAIAALAIVLRLPSVGVSIVNEDEGTYGAAGAAMLEGARPYEAGVMNKPPGIFYLYEAAFAIVGPYHLKAVHALTILWVLVTGWVLAGLVRRVAGDRAARWAAVFYFVFTTVHEPAVLATQAEILFALPLVAAAWCAVRAVDLERWATPFALAAGALCGIATLIKPTAVSLWLALLVWVFAVRPVIRREPILGRATVLTAALVTGFAATWLAAAAYLAHIGVGDEFMRWTFGWTLGTYIPAGHAHFEFLSRLIAAFLPWAAAALALLIMAGRGVARTLRGAGGDPARVALLALWAAAAFATLCLGGRFYDQYFPAVITPLAALAGVGAASLPPWRAWSTRLVAAGVALPGVVCFALAANFDRAMALFDDRPPIAEVGAYIAGHTRPSDRIFVWVGYPALYVVGRRLPATRFVDCHYLTGYAAIGLGRRLPPEVEDRFGLPGGFDQLVRELEDHRAELVIDNTAESPHRWAPYPMSRYPVLARYVAEHYEQEAVVGKTVIYRRRR